MTVAWTKRLAQMPADDGAEDVELETFPQRLGRRTTLDATLLTAGRRDGRKATMSREKTS